jgi:hypothetical protein
MAFRGWAPIFEGGANCFLKIRRVCFAQEGGDQAREGRFIWEDAGDAMRQPRKFREDWLTHWVLTDNNKSLAVELGVNSDQPHCGGAGEMVFRRVSNHRFLTGEAATGKWIGAGV